MTLADLDMLAAKVGEEVITLSCKSHKGPMIVLYMDGTLVLRCPTCGGDAAAIAVRRVPLEPLSGGN